MCKEIPLSQGKFALVDDEDFEWLSKYKWCYGSAGYAVRFEYGQERKRKSVLMHRVIAETPEGMDTDHINGDGLDNRRENLRVCFRYQNNANSKISSANTSGFKGVHWHKINRKWRSQIRVFGKRVELGSFDNPIDAANAYNNAAKLYFGNFFRTNY